MTKRPGSSKLNVPMNRRQRLRTFTFDHLRAIARREWQLGVLALIGLAPGVATLLAWSNLAVAVENQREVRLVGWLLPEFIIKLLGAEGVLLGAGMVTLLIGCLGLTNVYLASLERRLPGLLLLRRLGLRREELLRLLALEGVAIGLLSGGVGLTGGLLLSWITWGEAVAYFALPSPYRLSATAPLVAVAIGFTAVLLFLHTAARLMIPINMTLQPHASPDRTAWPALRNSWLGAGYGVLLALLAGLAVLPIRAALTLALMTGIVGTLLNGGGWLLTYFYRSLPHSPQRPLWTLAVQGLARHPNYTAGMTLAMAAGTYAVGLAALSWLVSGGTVHFPFWVAALVLVAAATLVFTVAALAVWERRTELAMLQALGARRRRLRQFILLEYGIVALGGGSVGAFLALATWALAGIQQQWPVALALMCVNLLGALFTAWIGAIPAVRQVAIRGRKCADVGSSKIS